MNVKDYQPEKALTPSASLKDVGSIREISSVEQSIKFDHGIEREAQGSAFLAFFNVVCVVAGMGALGLPNALRQGGWMGLLILGLSWIFSTYSGIILVRSLYYNGQTRLSSYQEVAEAAFGRIGGWVAFFFTAVILIGVPVLYILLAGQNLHAVLKGTPGELTFAIWTIICAAIVAIPFLGVKSLKEIGILSAFGMLATVVTVLIVIVKALEQKGLNPAPHYDAVIWTQFPMALSTISFSFGGNPVYAHVEAGMRNPRNWNKVIISGLTTCVVLYFIAAVPGYYVYGDQSLSPVYDNLPDGPYKTAAAVIMTVHVILAAPILMTSFALDLEKLFGITTFNHSRFVEYVLRFGVRGTILVVTTVIAIFVPFFGDFMALLGAFSNCALVFIFPVVFYYKLTGFRNKPFYELILGFFVILMGIVGLIFGTKSAIEALRADFAGLNAK
ncbi:hypothetical protein DFQ28_004182 [Apophysomyces sp. BC1034]|nr:hypothetical protein DFQ30_005997 [Apophysomyces sp. BC1015]KAG0177601.1 hypothetical protein DFQ29_004653 [Apophysomyces sp. BC1021]KAG0188904.1 hypothetical protein DFQ28_004182 [Apophysomyces sp. BC1034]